MRGFTLVGWVFLGLNIACRSDKEENKEREEPEGAYGGECSDGADNDYDGDYDCNDSDCSGAPDCTTQSDVGTADNPGVSCKEILDSGGSHGDGTYWITADNETFEIYCDMTTNGGGWTRIIYWDRKDDDMSYTDFLNLFTVQVNTMGVWINDSRHIRWADGDGSNDSFLLTKEVLIPNDGGWLLDIHLEAEGVDNAAVFLSSSSASNIQEEIKCHDAVWNIDNFWSSEEVLAYPEYTCTSENHEGDNQSFEWIDSFHSMSSNEIQSIEFSSLASDLYSTDPTDVGYDRIDLYRFVIYVR